MKIRFGVNEYTLVPGSAIQENENNLEVRILDENINLEDLENVLLDNNNVSSIDVIDENGTKQIYKDWGKLINIRKEYNMLYWTEQVDNEMVKHVANIIYITFSHPGLESQVEMNKANIEFLAIMNDIDL